MPLLRKRLQLTGAIGLLALIAAAATGCRTSLNSGLPDGIRTVEVHIFQNKTMYNNIEAWVTRGIVDRINMDPAIRVAGSNGDALITGEITNVTRSTLRETTSNEPGTVQITISATFSFYDNNRRRFIIEDAEIVSSGTGMSYGVYEASRGGVSEDGERAASKHLAAEIVRRTIGMW